MKDRIITLAFAVLAFLLSIYLLFPAQSERVKVSLPTTEDRGSEGLMGLYRWMETNAFPVYSLRKRYSHLLNNQVFASTGNILLMSMPQQRSALDSEWQALRKWIEKGNTIIVLGAGYYLPDWVDNRGDFNDIDQLLSGFSWDIYSDQDESGKDPDDEGSKKSFKQTIENLKTDLETFLPKQVTLQPKSKHTLLQAVSSIQCKITPSLLERYWTINTEYDNLALQLLVLSEQPDVTVMWQMEAGAGQIFLSLLPNLFSNETLNQADNARFFSNMITQNLGKNGMVIFDDYHFGLSDLYDPEQFFSDARLHKTLGFIGLLWLLYVLGYSNRLAPVREPAEKPSALDFVEAMAGFFANRLDNSTLAEALVRQLIYDVRQHRHLHDDQTAWQWLQQHPGLTSPQFSLLQKAEHRQRLSLQLLTNTITEIRKTTLL